MKIIREFLVSMLLFALAAAIVWMNLDTVQSFLRYVITRISGAGT